MPGEDFSKQKPRKPFIAFEASHRTSGRDREGRARAHPTKAYLIFCPPSVLDKAWERCAVLIKKPGGFGHQDSSLLYVLRSSHPPHL